MTNCVEKSNGTGELYLEGGTDSNNYGLDKMEQSEMKSNYEETYYTKGNLKRASGWTEKLIKELLGEPDYVKENCVFGNVLEGGAFGSRVWRRTLCYLSTKVEAAEKTDAFQNGRRILPWEKAQLNAVGGANQ